MPVGPDGPSQDGKSHTGVASTLETPSPVPGMSLARLNEVAGRGGGFTVKSTETPSTPELRREATEARREAELTLGMGEDILDRVREVAHGIEARVRQAARGAGGLAGTGS